MGQRKRPDIQSLRAVAVTGVVLYHLRPLWLPGGFVGVDVFFVISGYLITSSLVREISASGTVRPTVFWARRIRRLMPAASLVLVVTMIATRLLLSVAQWWSVGRGAVASALSVQNWTLASEAVAYLQATTAPSPLQHFWSLSVEEQFYLVWPLLLLAGIVIARRRASNTLATLRILVAVPLLVSFWYSIHATAQTPDLAYFSTFTRSWELLIGAALALWQPLLRLGRLLSGVALFGGLLVIAASMVLIDSASPFPGVVALAPTVGAAAVVLGGVGAGPSMLRRAYEWRPFTYLGDISYSLYLWHWPMIVITAAVLQQPTLPRWYAVGVLLVSMVLAALTKKHVEDRFLMPRSRPAVAARNGSAPAERPVRYRRAAYALGAVLLVTTGSFAGALRVSQNVEVARISALPSDNYPGGRVLDPHYDPSRYTDKVVAPRPTLLMLQDIERQLREPCLAPAGQVEVSSCEGGVPTGQRTVLLAGDSHAAEWLPALEEIGRRDDWRIVVAAKQSCPLLDPDLVLDAGNPVYGQCLEWNRSFRGFVTDLHPDLVVTSAAFYGYSDGVTRGDPAYDEKMGAAYAQQYLFIRDLGIPVVAIEETPIFTGFSAPTCLSDPRATVDKCTRDMSAAMVTQPSRIRMAAQVDPDLAVVSVNDLLCSDGVCPAAVGNTTTYRDDNHLTPQYAGSLAWYLESALKEQVPSLFATVAGG